MVANCTREQVEKIIADPHDLPGAAVMRRDWERHKHCTHFQGPSRPEVPAEIHHWAWSTTFCRWTALVTFKDGWRGYTTPVRRPADRKQEKGAPYGGQAPTI